LDTLLYDVGVFATALMARGMKINTDEPSDLSYSRRPLAILDSTAQTNPSGAVIIVDANLPLGLGANLPEDAIYPLNLGDETGAPLDGANKYTIHFDKGATPPVNAFWSVTLYDPQGFQVANSLNRFAVSSWMPFKYNIDGSLDLYFQNESPGPDREVNWLPAPKGQFNLTMRLYAPKSDALTGRWNPPSITKTQGASNQMAQ
jgi:hypothetical protein